jgi:hypothetical protein
MVGTRPYSPSGRPNQAGMQLSVRNDLYVHRIDKPKLNRYADNLMKEPTSHQQVRTTGSGSRAANGSASIKLRGSTTCVYRACAPL